MIALDTSALIAIAFDEPEKERFASLISRDGAVIGGPSLVETKLVLNRIGADAADTFLKSLTREGRVSPVEFSIGMLEEAMLAVDRYGRGSRHPAKLNFGDCLSYAVAKVHRLPLLYKGEDFVHTDIEPVWRP